MPRRPAPPSARQVAFLVLRAVHRGGYADVELDRELRRKSQLSDADRRLVTQLVYGCTRQMRALDAIVDRLAAKPAAAQPADLRTILHLGLYQLGYLRQVPPFAAVRETVELAKRNGLAGLAGFANGLLRNYQRQLAAMGEGEFDPALDLESGPPGPDEAPESPAAFRARLARSPLGFPLPADPVQALALRYSYPDWIVQTWHDRLGLAEAERLCRWFDRPPAVDLRVNRLRVSVAEVAAAVTAAGAVVEPVAIAPEALRICGWRRSGESGESSSETHRDRGEGAGDPGRDNPARVPSKIQALPGYAEGWWTVQDASAQVVSRLLDPQPGERVADICAAPGGKTTHIAELMGDRGEVWAIDRTASRLRRLGQTVRRLGLRSVRALAGDSSAADWTQFEPVDLAGRSKKSQPEAARSEGSQADPSPPSNAPPAIPDWGDRLLLDAPCSGLGTLHRRADARWRQTPDKVRELAALQAALLDRGAAWVKPGGVAVYATCTLHEPENGAIVRDFLARHPNWTLDPPERDSSLGAFVTPEGWLELWPHRTGSDGFFAARLRRSR